MKLLKKITPLHTLAICFGLTVIFFILGIATGTSIAWINTTATVLTLITLFHIPVIWVGVQCYYLIKKLLKK